MEALQALANAFQDLLKSEAIGYIKKEVIKRTVLAGLWSALSPTVWLKVGKIIGKYSRPLAFYNTTS